jgi:hypothetical protein
MVANLGAANKYEASHLEAPERQELIQNAKVFCATGFFLTVAPGCLVSIGKHAAENNKVLRSCRHRCCARLLAQDV